MLRKIIKNRRVRNYRWWLKRWKHLGTLILNNFDKPTFGVSFGRLQWKLVPRNCGVGRTTRCCLNINYLISSNVIVILKLNYLINPCIIFSELVPQHWQRSRVRLISVNLHIIKKNHLKPPNLKNQQEQKKKIYMNFSNIFLFLCTVKDSIISNLQSFPPGKE